MGLVLPERGFRWLGIVYLAISVFRFPNGTRLIILNQIVDLS